MFSDSEHRTAVLLAAAQAMFQTASVIVITVGGLVGLELAPDARLATLPLAVVMFAGMLAMIPAALLMQRFGRRAGFLAGCGIGIAAGLLAVLAVHEKSFWLFLASNALHGIYSAFAGYYRFAAADAASAAFRSQALSWVVAGGVAAALIGPALVRYTGDLGQDAFSAAFMAVMAFGAIGLIIVSRLRLPQLANPSSDDAAPSRTLGAIFRQPVFITAMTGTTIGFAVMVMVMTATPLAMQICGLPMSSSATVIQWHMLGMFVPSFFTGKLIQRFGVLPVMALGAVLLGAHVAVALAGIAFQNFVAGLILLGVGWNFLFVGGSTLLTEAYRPAERARAQAAHDFIVYGAASIASLGAGGLLAMWGWRAVNIAALPALAVACLAIFALARQRHAANKREGIER